MLATSLLFVSPGGMKVSTKRFGTVQARKQPGCAPVRNQVAAITSWLKNFVSENFSIPNYPCIPSNLAKNNEKRIPATQNMANHVKLIRDYQNSGPGR